MTNTTYTVIVDELEFPLPGASPQTPATTITSVIKDIPKKRTREGE